MSKPLISPLYSASDPLIEFLPVEDAGTNYGVGFIPTLEITGAQDPTKVTFPSSHALNTELCELLAMTEPANAVKDFTSSMQAVDCPATKETLAFKWPSAGKEVGKKASAGNSISLTTGKQSFLTPSPGIKLKPSTGHI